MSTTADGKPSIDMNGYKGSDKLVAQTLIEGNGPEITDDTYAAVVKYAGCAERGVDLLALERGVRDLRQRGAFGTARLVGLIEHERAIRHIGVPRGGDLFASLEARDVYFARGVRRR